MPEDHGYSCTRGIAQITEEYCTFFSVCFMLLLQSVALSQVRSERAVTNGVKLKRKLWLTSEVPVHLVKRVCFSWISDAIFTCDQVHERQWLMFYRSLTSWGSTSALKFNIVWWHTRPDCLPLHNMTATNAFLIVQCSPIKQQNARSPAGRQQCVWTSEMSILRRMWISFFFSSCLWALSCVEPISRCQSWCYEMSLRQEVKSCWKDVWHCSGIRMKELVLSLWAFSNSVASSTAVFAIQKRQVPLPLPLH